MADALGMEDISGDELVGALTRSGAGMSVYSKIGGVVVLTFSENHKLLYICMLKGWRSGWGRGACEWLRYLKSVVSMGEQGRRAGGRADRDCVGYFFNGLFGCP